jgi:2-oxoglutarate ferredoxin oxidoreductase subunit alpha
MERREMSGQMKSANVLIGGEAGQGLVTVGELLAKSLVRAGYHIVVTQTYMSRIRGGHNTFAIRTGADPVAAPQAAVDLLVALNDETVTLHEKELTSDGMTVADAGSKVRIRAPCLRAPFHELASGNLVNVAAMGVAGCLLNLAEADLGAVVGSYFGVKKAELAEGNRRALANAYAWTLSQSPVFPRLVPPSFSTGRLMMNGNDAIAVGALSAGVKFCSFYPMTPSTSIALNFVKHGASMGVVVEQAEDEISAVNMALGASFAGAPSLVATSGGGFALMVEGVSLAGMTETPIVIVVGQRPGPATGLPTRTEQGDLNFVLHGGHGEFPRAIFAPGSVEECFDLTRKAFTLAERHQGPVFLLTDQFLADSYRDIAPFNPAHTPCSRPLPRPERGAPYKRFAVTESGVSPRFLPGIDKELVVAGSDEHTEDGHITEDLDARKRMVEKRLRKRQGIAGEVIPPALSGESNPDLLLVSWGSSLGAVSEAAAAIRGEGVRTAVLHFSQVWPLVPGQFADRLKSARKVVCVEGNATGQFAGLLRRETGFHIEDMVLRYDGLPFTADYIRERVSHVC